MDNSSLMETERNENQIERLDSVFELEHTSPGKTATNDRDHSDFSSPTPFTKDLYALVVQDAVTFFNFVRSLKLEVITFLYFFSYAMRSVSSTTMTIEKICIVHFELSESVCANLNDHKAIKTEVEKMANNYHLFHTLVQIVPSGILSSFIGTWSDRYGRKLPIVIALIGIILDGSGAIACAAYKYSRVEYYAVSATFTGLSGGFITVLTVVYSWASDTTQPESRTFKYALLELALGMGVPLGKLAGGLIYKSFGYVAVFSVSVAGHVFGLLWVIFFIQETRGFDSKDSLKVKLRSFFTVDSMLESFRTVAKRRPHNARLQILLLVLSMFLSFLAFASSNTISYMFAFHMYNWDNTKFSVVSAIYSVLGMFSILIFVPLLTKVLKKGDATLGMMGSLSVVVTNVTLAWATNEGLYYLASLFGVFSGMANLAGRSRISKMVDKDDLGKVFSFVSTAESLAPVVGTAIFTQIFNASLNIDFPGLANLILGLLMVISFFIFVWIGKLPFVNYETLQEETDENERHEENLTELNAVK